jgi:hypothetical protein
MSLDISNIAYLAFRMAPFIIVSYFLFQSILNWEIRGFIYAIGLVVACVLIYFTNPFLLSFFSPKSETFARSAKCNIISLGSQGQLLSEIPLSIAVYTYTFVYLLMFMLNTDNLHLALIQNIPTFIVFPALIILETTWIILNDCITQPFFLILTAIIISAAIAAAWAAIIIQTKNTALAYTHNNHIGQLCNRPSKTLFRCKPQQF